MFLQVLIALNMVLRVGLSTIRQNRFSLSRLYLRDSNKNFFSKYKYCKYSRMQKENKITSFQFVFIQYKKHY
jgi:hypothetical protein